MAHYRSVNGGGMYEIKDNYGRPNNDSCYVEEPGVDRVTLGAGALFPVALEQAATLAQDRGSEVVIHEAIAGGRHHTFRVDGTSPLVQQVSPQEIGAALWDAYDTQVAGQVAEAEAQYAQGVDFGEAVISPIASEYAWPPRETRLYE